MPELANPFDLSVRPVLYTCICKANHVIFYAFLQEHNLLNEHIYLYTFLTLQNT